MQRCDMMVATKRKLRLTDFLYPQDAGSSFAVIGGNRDIRNYIGLYALSRACGHSGVIVLHADPGFEEALPQVLHFNPSGTSRGPGFRASYANSGRGLPEDTFFYSPLFGLSEAAALNALLPRQEGAYHPQSIHVRSALRCYWRILAAIGQDCCLDNLLTLVEMPLQTLEASVLPMVQEPQRSQYRAELSALDAQQDAMAAVLSFAGDLEDRIWTRRSQHTGLSLVTAVRQRHLISLYLQPNQHEVINYLDLELQALAVERTPFLLVSCALPLQGTSLYDRFFSEHPGYATGVIAASLTGTLDEGQPDASALIASHQDTVVLSCADFRTADAFSLSCGNVLIREAMRTSGRQRTAFGMRSTMNHGWTEQAREERCVRPEILMELGGGALLINAAKLSPTLISQIVLPD